jgi:uncharacterized membrane protein YhiD involved in acid resistance
MEAGASIWLAIGSALYFAGTLAAVALCRMALLRGIEVEWEIKAPSFCLKFHARSRTETTPSNADWIDAYSGRKLQ